MKEKQVIKFTNRYDTVISFVRVGRKVVVTGYDEWLRFGTMNDYSKAYDKYVKSDMYVGLTLEEFADELHDSELLSDMFSKYLETTPEIAYCDPSGGPFMSVGMDLGTIDNDMRGKIVTGIASPGGEIILTVKNK